MRNRLIFSILVAIILMLSLSSFCLAEDNSNKRTIPAFPAYYASVSHVLKYDEGCFQQLMSSKQMNNISKFWWGYIMKECFLFMNDQIDVISKSSRSQEDINIEIDLVKGQCAMAVIFDNWERINLTIVKDPAKECISKKNKP